MLPQCNPTMSCSSGSIGLFCRAWRVMRHVNSRVYTSVDDVCVCLSTLMWITFNVSVYFQLWKDLKTPIALHSDVNHFQLWKDSKTQIALHSLLELLFPLPASRFGTHLDRDSYRIDRILVLAFLSASDSYGCGKMFRTVVDKVKPGRVLKMRAFRPMPCKHLLVETWMKWSSQTKPGRCPETSRMSTGHTVLLQKATLQRVLWWCQWLWCGKCELWCGKCDCRHFELLCVTTLVQTFSSAARTAFAFRSLGNHH